MKKRLWSFVLACLLCMVLTVPAFAIDIDRCCDNAHLLSKAEYGELNTKLDAISERLHFDVVVVTLDSLEGWDIGDAADSIYDEYHLGYGANRDGVILLVAMDTRDWIITAKGFGSEAINKDAQAYISKQIVPYLSSGEYANAFGTFAALCDSMVTNAKDGTVNKAPFNAPKSLGIAVVVSLIVALIVVGSMKGKLKSVGQKYGAGDYIVPGSLDIVRANERYLYCTVSRTAKPKNNSSGSSGGSVSTRGKF